MKRSHITSTTSLKRIILQKKSSRSRKLEALREKISMKKMEWETMKAVNLKYQSEDIKKFFCENKQFAQWSRIQIKKKHRIIMEAIQPDKK